MNYRYEQANIHKYEDATNAQLDHHRHEICKVRQHFLLKILICNKLKGAWSLANLLSKIR